MDLDIAVLFMGVPFRCHKERGEGKWGGGWEYVLFFHLWVEDIRKIFEMIFWNYNVFLNLSYFTSLSIFRYLNIRALGTPVRSLVIMRDT